LPGDHIPAWLSVEGSCACDPNPSRKHTLSMRRFRPRIGLRHRRESAPQSRWNMHTRVPNCATSCQATGPNSAREFPSQTGYYLCRKVHFVAELLFYQLQEGRLIRETPTTHSPCHSAGNAVLVGSIRWRSRLIRYFARWNHVRCRSSRFLHL
jgi:hypothetical protein